MRRMLDLLDRPRSAYTVLVPLVVATWLLSGIGHDSGEPRSGLGDQLATLAWAVCWLSMLATTVLTVAVLLRRVLRRSVTTS